MPRRREIKTKGIDTPIAILTPGDTVFLIAEGVGLAAADSKGEELGVEVRDATLGATRFVDTVDTVDLVDTVELDGTVESLVDVTGSEDDVRRPVDVVGSGDVVRRLGVDAVFDDVWAASRARI